MVWYKVPCSSFDYPPASFDSVLVDRGVKKPEDHKLPTSLLTWCERDARTMSLVSSCMDMAKAAAGRIIAEALKDKDLLQGATPLFTC